MIRTSRFSSLVSGLAVLCCLVSGCDAPAASALPTQTFGPTPLTPLSPSPAPSATPLQVFPADSFLFVEVQDERVRKSETGRETSSVAGEQASYSYDTDAGLLSGTLEGSLIGSAPTVVGYVVVRQTDRIRAVAGRLYALPEEGKLFGPVMIERPQPDGTIRFALDGQEHALRPGESARLRAAANGSGEGLPAGQVRRTVTVTNHGFHRIDNLTATAQ